MSPASRMSTRQPMALRKTRILASLLPFALHCQMRPTTLSTQRRLPAVPRESAKTHPRAQLHRSDAIWDPMPILRPRTHHPRPRLSECPPINRLFPGIGPQVVDLNSQANPSLHPAFTRMNGIASSLGSLLNNKSDNNLTHATDVWYFTRGLNTPEKPQTMPEQEVLSEKRPNPKSFVYLGCRLCP